MVISRFRNQLLPCFIVIGFILLSGFAQRPIPEEPEEYVKAGLPHTPKIASWLAKKEEIIRSRKPYDFVMSGWFTPEEARKIRAQSPNVKLLAGLSFNWVWDNKEWMKFLTTVANYGKKNRIKIKENMYLKKPNGQRCAFGWASGGWGHEEIYAMDPRNSDWIDLITSFYKTILDQPQHDGIIVDMVVEKQWWCPDAITDQEWLRATKAIMAAVRHLNTENKLVIFNAGKDLSDIDEYSEFFDGYVMENLLGNQIKTTFDDGLKAAKDKYIVIYAVDTDDTGRKDLKKMRLGLTLSLLNDNTYFTYDFGPRDHGQAWWFSEYDADLGSPLGNYYKKDNAYWREFERGIVISSPYSRISVSFEEEYIDATTQNKSKSFNIDKSDGRIFIKK